MFNLRKIKMLTQYCWEQRKPVIFTGIRLKKLHKETANSFEWLVDVNYLFSENRDTYLTHNDYIDAVLKVNDVAARQFMNDKGNLLKRCPDLIGRDFLILKTSTREEVLDFISTHRKFVSKVNNLKMGEGFFVYDSVDGSPAEIFEKIIARGADILEGYVYQHPDINEIYPHSVNTIRIHTVNNGKEIKCFIKPHIRLGVNGNVLDKSNESYRLVLNPDGTVSESVVEISRFLKKAYYHKDTGKKFSEIKIPFMDEMNELVKKAAARCPETPYVGWDVAVTENGPVLIEGNGCSGCFNKYQQISSIYYNRGMKKEIMEMLKFVHRD